MPARTLIEKFVFDPVHGIGAVPNNQEVEYLGFVREMTPAEFLRLALLTCRYRSADDIEQMIRDGRAVGQPFLNVKWLPEQKCWQVIDHDGRNRAKAIQRIDPNALIPVHIFPQHLRARQLTPEMKAAPMLPQKAC